MSNQLLTKLNALGIVESESSLAAADGVTVSGICRRRLPVLLVRLKMSETVKAGVQLIEQGQIRVGPNVITDPSFLVTRKMEDFVTWVDKSKIRRKVEKYNGKLDDFDLLEG
jgi:U3 small nucleolar ribonucleoprotein protein IMP3